MYLKRLELSGFKSFAKKTTLLLDTPMTAIVGPNGSGKSNVAEAVRFVLGEQSMKSLRGKVGADLIFKGSKTAGGMGRGSVTIVFDNKKRHFSKGAVDGGINVDFDEVAISREVFGDGENHYLVNGTQVRLKDILELLAPLNIGSSGHHIISQGEADKILNASIRERKEMIEDALGLRVYQYKIEESERKLEKTNGNIKEADLLRRELAPHIVFLKKQVEKIEKAQEMRAELRALYLDYFAREEAYLKEEAEKLEVEVSVKKELAELEKELVTLKRALSLSPADEASEDKRRKMEEELERARGKKDELSRRIGRLEGMIELEEERAHEMAKSTADLGLSMVTFHEVEALAEEISRAADEALAGNSPSLFERALRSIRESVALFIRKKREGKGVVAEAMEKKLAGYKNERLEAEEELAAIAKKEEELSSSIASITKAFDEAKETLRDKERSFFELSSKRSELSSRANILSMKEEKLKGERADFARELAEAAALAGEEVGRYGVFTGKEEERNVQEDRRRKIERLKIRLEDSGVGSTGETLTEYEGLVKRDQFLETEITDLKKSKTSLEGLIKELKEKLSHEFKDGVGEINKEFTEFFKMMFGGGFASLSVVKREKRQYRVDEEDLEAGALLSDEEKEFEEGIDINVSLPQKKIRDLAMLSGGERALTSIALLFAISRVNPPPFLVLDETDAALDEANSRKYGDMLESLSKVSHLIVITHNRETMTRAGVLYGITMGADGTSKLLSVKFDEAAVYAK